MSTTSTRKRFIAAAMGAATIQVAPPLVSPPHVWGPFSSLERLPLAD